jgi:APA family basic amino acid/polyamine antiporter
MKRNPNRNSKGIGLFDIIIAGLSGAIGFEIFVLLNYAYFHLAGPDIVIALVLGGIINLLLMLSYCELGAAMPKIGGEYTYIKTAYGGYIGFISGCFRWLANIFGAALATVAFVLQLAYLLSSISPQVQVAILNQAWLISIVVVALMGFLDVRGTKKAGSIIVIAFVILFLGFIIGGFAQGFGSVNLFSTPLTHGTAGVFTAAVYIFPMFIGTRAITAYAPIAKKPEKDIPRGLLLSALLIIPLYVFLGIVAVSTVTTVETIPQSSLLIFAAGRIFGGYGGILFAIAGMVACLSAIGTSLSVQSSIARGMSRDGYFPKILLAVHPRFGTTYIATIVGAAFIILLSVLGAVPFLGYAAGFGSLFVFAIVNLSLMKLRKTKPYMDRPFKTPLYPITPILGVVFSISLLLVPVLVGDGNAIDALTSAIGLAAIVLSSYYLRMIGRYRVQIALGGIGIGIGAFMAIISILNILGTIKLIVFIPAYIQFLFSIILLVTGYFNMNSHNQDKNE